MHGSKLLIDSVGLRYAYFTKCHVFLLEHGTYCHLHKFALLLSCKGGHNFGNAFTCSTQVTTFASHRNVFYANTTMFQGYIGITPTLFKAIFLHYANCHWLASPYEDYRGDNRMR